MKRGDLILADTCDPVVLKEVVKKKILNPVYYISKEDVSMELFLSSKLSTNCPIKGDASYWHQTEKDNDGTGENLACSYEDPYEYSMPIKGRIAFNTKRVTIDR